MLVLFTSCREGAFSATGLSATMYSRKPVYGYVNPYLIGPGLGALLAVAPPNTPGILLHVWIDIQGSEVPRRYPLSAARN